METHSHPEIIQMQVQMVELSKKVELHDQILVTGSDDRLSLPEIVRSLSLTVDTYIKRKEKEEIQKQEQWDKFKWLILSFGIPIVLGFVGQLVWFYVKFIQIATELVNK